MPTSTVRGGVGCVVAGCIGLFGMYFNFTRAACVDVGADLLTYWEQNQHRSNLHRLVVYLFTTEVLYAQLRLFVTAAGDDKPALDNFPELFMFVLRVVLLTCVGHYLEGRHRYVALQLAVSANTKPGFQSFKMRWPARRRIQVAD